MESTRGLVYKHYTFSPKAQVKRSSRETSLETKDSFGISKIETSKTRKVCRKPRPHNIKGHPRAVLPDWCRRPKIHNPSLVGGLRAAPLSCKGWPFGTLARAAPWVKGWYFWNSCTTQVVGSSFWGTFLSPEACRVHSNILVSFPKKDSRILMLEISLESSDLTLKGKTITWRSYRPRNSTQETHDLCFCDCPPFLQLRTMTTHHHSLWTDQHYALSSKD